MSIQDFFLLLFEESVSREHSQSRSPDKGIKFTPRALPHTPPHLEIGQLQPWQRGSDGCFHMSLFEIQGLMKHGLD